VESWIAKVSSPQVVVIVEISNTTHRRRDKLHELSYTLMASTQPPTSDLVIKLLPVDLPSTCKNEGSGSDTQTEPYAETSSSDSETETNSTTLLAASKVTSADEAAESSAVKKIGAATTAAAAAKKKIDDIPRMYDAKTLHMVRGKYYDMSKFNHPGGDMVIQQGVGSDITAAVACHHFTNAPYIAMREYEVPIEQVQGTILNGGYSFKENGFHNVLKKRIIKQVANGEAHKMRVASKPSNWYIAHVVGVLSLYVLSWGYCCFAPTFSWVVALVAMCTRTSLVGIGHEAIHGRLSSTLFYLFGMILCHPSDEWHDEHVLQHHPHTRREGMDPDEDGLSPILRLNKWTKWGPWHVVQILVQCVISFFFSIGLWLEHGLVNSFIRNDKSGQSPRSFSKYFFTQTASMLMFQLLPLLVATHGHALHVMFVVIGMSNMLTLHAFHVSHINEQNEVDGGEPDGMDWGEWQCRTSSNWDSGWEVTGMLEYQIEHHLFPSLPYEIQKNIRPLVRKTCQEFDVPYFEYPSMSRGIYAHLQYLWSMSFDGFYDIKSNNIEVAGAAAGAEKIEKKLN